MPSLPPPSAWVDRSTLWFKNRENLLKLAVMLASAIGLIISISGILEHMFGEDTPLRTMLDPTSSLPLPVDADDLLLCSTVEPDANTPPVFCFDPLLNVSCVPVNPKLHVHANNKTPVLKFLRAMYVSDVLCLVLPLIAFTFLSCPLCCCCPCMLCLLCCRRKLLSKLFGGVTKVVQKISMLLSLVAWPFTLILTVLVVYWVARMTTSQYYLTATVDYEYQNVNNKACLVTGSAKCSQYYAMYQVTDEDGLQFVPANITARDCLSDDLYFHEVEQDVYNSLYTGVPALALSTFGLGASMYVWRKTKGRAVPMLPTRAASADTNYVVLDDLQQSSPAPN
eukprot:TRINITY_DN482_c0_g1_i1.p1 TRINITY_DN482_c0_g1~~TRINITY_DN482_c0_g1_i1.p1  ORF type:complete len:389 (-),score=92.58 TRINITY_DN482_c0_g1_i1:50-1063(-)